MSGPIPLEDVARFPRPGTAVPQSLAFSPDDRLVTYLLSSHGTLEMDLVALDAESGERRVLLGAAAGTARESALSLEEALRRERRRERGLGVTRYAWAKERGRLLAQLAGGLHVLDVPGGRPRLVVDAAAGPALAPRLSPDGSHVAFARDAELHVADAETGAVRQVTSGARGTGRTHGLAEYVAQEEMGRHDGFWWSPDGRLLAFAEVDDTHVPVYRIVHQGKDAVGEGAQEDHRYPFAGAANARVRLGVVSREGGEPVWMDLGMDLGGAEYLARVKWFPDGSLVAQIDNREQTELRLVRLDPLTGRGTALLAERSPTWINLHDVLEPLAGDGGAGFLWASERTGYRHLYVHDHEGRLVRALTSGEWLVDSVAGVDEARGLVWFLGTRDGPTQKQLYVVPLAGGEPRRVTPERGFHEVVLDHARRRFLDVHTALDRPPTVTLRSLEDGRVVRVVHDAPDPRVEALGLRPPEIVTVRSRDGMDLFGLVYAPPPEFGPGPHPTVVSVYGGPKAQRAIDHWESTVEMRAQYLRGRGFLVLVLDNRGSGRRGKAFEDAVHRNLGDLEVRDQVDGVRWLVERGLADPARVGIYGWSYGGYVALLCLARAPETFRAAVAGAPVTNWDGYDTHYTERYMGTPASNPEGYRASSVMSYVDRIRGDLLLVHGLLDENVHFRHTARLVNALNRARKRYELLLFPDERHMPRSEADRLFMEERIAQFLERALAWSVRCAISDVIYRRA